VQPPWTPKLRSLPSERSLGTAAPVQPSVDPAGGETGPTRSEARRRLVSRRVFCRSLREEEEEEEEEEPRESRAAGGRKTTEGVGDRAAVAEEEEGEEEEGEHDDSDDDGDDAEEEEREGPGAAAPTLCVTTAPPLPPFLFPLPPLLGTRYVSTPLS